tara:strand:+ start:244 stop:2088 length:1845 start_codon:yes stop_codon:yes gene_type:complete
MKPNKDLLISITKGNDTKEEYSAYQEEKQKGNEDLKIDLTSAILDKENFHGAKNVKENVKSHNYKIFDISTLEKQDVLVTQVPNLNEAGFFAGMASLIGYIRKYREDIKIQGIDPFTDYFFTKDIDLSSEFFADFNTFGKQGVVDYSPYEEVYEILEIFCKYIDQTRPDFLGFSVIDGNIDASLFFAEQIKSKYPDIKIMIGGCGVSLMGTNRLSLSVASNNCYDLKQYWFVDYIFLGDGEVTLIELYDSEFENLDTINGLVWKKDGEWIINNQRPYTDLNEVPLPDYSDFLENSYYKKYYDLAIPLTFSRGCNFRCTFCSVPTMVPLYRHKPIEKCLDEIGYWIDLNKHNYEKYSFWQAGWRLGMLAHDSILNGNPKWFEDLCQGIIDRGYGDKITWGGNLRLMLPMANIDTLKLYNKAGFEYMVTGFESASPRVLKHMKKNKNMKTVRKIFENIREINEGAGEDNNEYGNNNNKIKVQLQLIIGYLNETEEDFQMTLDFVEEFHDVIYEILTCSVFNLWSPLLKQWREEGEWIEYHSGVVWDTKYCTTKQRIERIERIEKLFDKLGLTYNTYHRGLMIEQYEDYKRLKKKSKTQFGHFKKWDNWRGGEIKGV